MVNIRQHNVFDQLLKVGLLCEISNLKTANFL